MTPLQVHYRKGDYCWVLGSLGAALDEEGFGVGPTFDNHRGQNFILPLVLPEPCPVCTDFIPFSRRPCSLASPDKAGWHGGGRTVVPPRSVHDGEQSHSMCGREGGKKKPSKASVLAFCWGYPVQAELQPVSRYSVWSRGREGRGAECRGAAISSWCHALAWYHLPSLLGQRSPCKSYSAVSGKIWFSLILPGSAWLAGLISLK